MPETKGIFELRLPPRFAALVERFKPGSKASREQGGMPRHHGPGHQWRRPVERAASPWKCFIRIIGMAREKSLWILLVLVLVCCGAGISTLTPMLLKEAVDSLNMLTGKPDGDMGRLLTMFGYLAGTYAISAILSFFQGWLSEKLAQDTLYEMRKRLFSHLQSLPLKFFDTRTHGEILSRATNDVGMVSQMMSNGVVMFFASVLSLICALIAMLCLSPLLTLAAVATLPLCFLLTKIMSKRIRACFTAQQTVLGLLNSHVEEIISAQKVVKAFNYEERAMADFSALNREMRRIGIWARIMAGSMPPIMGLLNNLGYAILVGVGGWLASDGIISIGVIAAFIQYARQFSRPATEIANQYNEIQSALAGAERVFAILDEAPESDEGTKSLPVPVRGELEFANVTFAYKEGEPVLKDFTLKVEPGKKIALVGTTGAGKTTVVSLLMRFYEPGSGVIKLDGVPLSEMPRAELMGAIAMVLQDTWLFRGTVRENIRYGKLDSTDAQVEAAATSVGADMFISRLPNGYDTELGDNGGSLSQGQRQLISIARAVLADAPVLILDEATSNVDTRTELLVQRAMLHLMKGRTCIVIAHRLSTIRDADAILVMEHGRIVEQGKRHELLAAKGAYWSLEQSQYRGLENSQTEAPVSTGGHSGQAQQTI